MLNFLHTVPLRSDFSSISFLWFHFCLIAKTPTKTENGLHQITGGYSRAWGVPGVPPLCIYSVFWGPPIRKLRYNQHPASRYQSVSNDHYASFVHCIMTPTGYKWISDTNFRIQKRHVIPPTSEQTPYFELHQNGLSTQQARPPNRQITQQL